MENKNHYFSSSKHTNSLCKIEENIKGLKTNIRETYKKTKCNNEKEQEILYKNFERIFFSLNEIQRESFNLDDMQVWESFLIATDSNKIEELEKKASDEFIFSAQLARGKYQKIKDFYKKLKETSANIISKSNRQENIDKLQQLNSNTNYINNEMDIDL